MTKHFILGFVSLLGISLFGGCGLSQPKTAISTGKGTSPVHGMGTPGKVAKTSPHATTTESSSPSMPESGETLMDMEMFSMHTGWALNTQGQVLLTTDGGRDWTNVSNPPLTDTLKPIASGWHQNGGGA
jgi:hypothetical protein